MLGQEQPAPFAAPDDAAEALRQLLAGTDLVFWVRELLPVERISFLNEAFERVWGMPAQALFDDPTAWLRQTHDGDRDRVAREFGDWARGGFTGAFKVDYRIRRGDGGVRWISDQARCWRRADGAPYRITGVAEDVTQQRLAEQRLRESDMHFKTLVESLPHMVWTCRPDGRCDYLSPQWLAYTGVSMHEDFVAKWTDQVHPEDREAIVAAWRDAVRLERSYSRQYRLRRHDGAYGWFRSHAVPLHGEDGRVVRWFGTLTDIDGLMQAEATLRDERNRFAHIAASIPSVLHTYRRNPDGTVHFTYGSERAAELFELPAEKLRADGNATLSRFDAPSLARLHAAIAVSERDLSPLLEDLRIVTPRHGERWIEIHSAPVADAQGGIDWHGSFVDISDRKRAEQSLYDSRAQLRSLFDHLGDGLITVTPDGRLRQWNKVARRMHGLAVDDAPQPAEEPVLALFDVRTLDGELVPRTDWPLSRLLRGEIVRDLEMRVHHREQGWDKVFSYSGELVRGADGQPIMSMLQVRDVTERRRSDDQLQQLRLSLEDRVRERTTALQSAMGELEAFSYSVSHDLRAPLRAMDGFLQLLMRDFLDRLPETGQRYLRIVHDSARKMSQLIDDLLAFARLSHQPLSTRTVDMRQVVLDVIGQFQPLQQGRDVEWRVAALPPCEGDLAMLRQVWVNLLSNALKYSRQRTPAVIEVGVSEASAEHPEYFVRDNGSGFDMAYAHKLFGVFERLHGDDEFEGTGVGLALVQRIVQRHGGRIRAQGASGQGATFSFSLGTEH